MQLTLEKILILKHVPLFADVPEPALADFIASSEEIAVVSGNDLVRQGDMWSHMYILLQGQIRIHRDDDIIADLSNHSVFGEIYALSPEKTPLTVTALEDSTLFRISGDALYQLMNEHKSIGRGIIASLCRQVRKNGENLY